MRFAVRVRSWLLMLVKRSQMEHDMDAELRFHVDSYAEDLAHSGVPREQALRRPRVAFGGLECGHQS